MNDDELRARMRAADPAASLPPADDERVERLLTDVMSTELTAVNQATGLRQRGALTWLVAAAAVAVIATVGALGLHALGGDGGTAPPPTAGASTPLTVTTLTAADHAEAKCAVPNAEMLGQAQVAVDATATAVTDDQVTLTPTHWYAGEPTDVVRVSTPPARLEVLFGATGFEEGQRYLVAANDGQLMVCGFSGPYDEPLAALYREAFGG